MNVTQSGSGYTPVTSAITGQTEYSGTVVYARNTNTSLETANGSVINNGGTPVITQITPENARLNYNNLTTGWSTVFEGDETNAPIYLTGSLSGTVGTFNIDISHIPGVTSAEIYVPTSYPNRTDYKGVLRDASGSDIGTPIGLSDVTAGWQSFDVPAGAQVSSIYIYIEGGGYPEDARMRFSAFRVNGEYLLNNETYNYLELTLTDDKDLANFRKG